MATLGDKLRDAVQSERKSVLEALTRLNKLEELSFKLDQIAGDQFSHIWLASQAYIYFNQGTDPAEASTLLRAFVKDTGIRLTKSFKSYQGTFAAQSDYTAEGPNIRFEDFVPQECHVEPVTRLVPEHEETTYKVVCNPPEAAEATVEPNGQEADLRESLIAAHDEAKSGDEA